MKLSSAARRASGATPASPTINDLYEYTKWVVRRGSAETIYGLDQAVAVFRGITHEIDISLYAARVIILRDGQILSDEEVGTPHDAREQLAAMPKNEDEEGEA